MTPEKKKKLIYWLVTTPFLLMMCLSVVVYLSHSPQVVEGFTHLGYPIYLLNILGTAKLLGIAAILFGRFATLKEWAYAGFTINLLGATASHSFSGDGFGKIILPLVFLALLLTSYRLWKRNPAPIAA